MFELIRLAIALGGSAAAGLWDLKTSEIPDSVCIAMIALGLSLFGLEGMLTGNWSGLIMSLVVGGAFLTFGLLMYFGGQWGGGDGELLVAIGVLLPAWPLTQISIFPMPLALFINLFFVGAIYAIFYALWLTAGNKKIRKQFFIKLRASMRAIIIAALGAAAIAVFVLWSFYALLLLVLAAALPPLYILLKTVEAGFYRRINTARLKPGDMIGQDIPELRINCRCIRGLTAAEIKQIRKLRRYVTIREGVRFGPVFPIALVVTLVLGDLISFVLL
jgi:prepilin signal peptidase PulO-like enzyme (type II secretory pathway)